MNYFENTNVQWNTWSPKDVIFKSNRTIKKLMPEENVLSWTSKGNRDTKMCERTGCKSTMSTNWQGQQHQYFTKENYKGVMIQLKDMKSDYPSANIDFIDYTHRKDSVGNNIGRLDVLVYLNSFHSPWEWVRCPKTNNWTKKSNGNVAPLDEGYRMCYGGQGDANSMSFQEFQELVQITEAVKNFLVEVLVPSLSNRSVELVEDEELLIA